MGLVVGRGMQDKPHTTFNDFNNTMYRPGPDVSTGFCHLHHDRPT